MQPIDVSAVNMTAPYSIWEQTGNYYFKTDYSVLYKVGFMDDDTIWEHGAYQFIIVNENNVQSPNDTKVRETVFCVMEAFFRANPEILLYLCETGDGKQAMRNRLFVRWFNQYPNHSLYYFDTVEITSEDVDNFAAIIVQQSNPQLPQIIKEFNEVVQELKKPEEN